MLILRYCLIKKADKDTIKTCNEAAKAMQNLFVEAARMVSPKIIWLMWLLGRVYFRKITDKSITYKFPLIPGGDKRIYRDKNYKIKSKHINLKLSSLYSYNDWLLFKNEVMRCNGIFAYQKNRISEDIIEQLRK